MPIFTREDVEGWLRSMDRYLKIHKIPLEEWVEKVMNCLEGEALQWIIWMEDHYSFQDWTDFKIQIRFHFNDDLSTNILHEFMDIKQTGTIRSYCQEFERLSVYLPPLPDLVLEETFLKGLKMDIQAELIDNPPKGLLQLMEEAKKVERQLQIVYKTSTDNLAQENTFHIGHQRMSRSMGHGSTRATFSTVKGSDFIHNRSIEVPQNDSTGKKWLLQFKRCKEKGLCFHCNDKFGPRHRCKKNLQIFVATEDDEQDIKSTDINNLPESEDCMGETDGQLLKAHVSVNLMLGWTNIKSIKLKRKLQGWDITILIDSGASHNFLCTNLIDECQISSDQSILFRFTLGNGKADKGQGLYQ